MGHRQVTHDPQGYGSCVLRDGARLLRRLDAQDRQSPRGGTERPGDGFCTPGVVVRCDGSDTSALAARAGPSHLRPRGVDAGDLRTRIFFGSRRACSKLNSRQAAVESLTTGLPNFASAGLPLIRSVFGVENTVSVGISIAVGSIVMSPLTLVFLEAGDETARDVPALRRISGALGKSILKPVVIAPIFGMVLTLCGVEVPRLSRFARWRSWALVLAAWLCF